MWKNLGNTGAEKINKTDSVAFYPKLNLIVGPLTGVSSSFPDTWRSLAREGTTEGGGEVQAFPPFPPGREGVEDGPSLKAAVNESPRT